MKGKKKGVMRGSTRGAVEMAREPASPPPNEERLHPAKRQRDLAEATPEATPAPAQAPEPPHGAGPGEKTISPVRRTLEDSAGKVKGLVSLFSGEDPNGGMRVGPYDHSRVDSVGHDPWGILAEVQDMHRNVIGQDLIELQGEHEHLLMCLGEESEKARVYKARLKERGEDVSALLRGHGLEPSDSEGSDADEEPLHIEAAEAGNDPGRQVVKAPRAVGQGRRSSWDAPAAAEHRLPAPQVPPVQEAMAGRGSTSAVRSGDASIARGQLVPVLVAALVGAISVLLGVLAAGSGARRVDIGYTPALAVAQAPVGAAFRAEVEGPVPWVVCGGAEGREEQAQDPSRELVAQREAAEGEAQLVAQRRALDAAAKRHAAEEAEQQAMLRRAVEEKAEAEQELARRRAALEEQRAAKEAAQAEEAARVEAERKAAEEAARLEAERKAMAAEEAARVEAERKAAEEEEAARVEAERKAAEEAARVEAERKAAAEEAARVEAERKAAEEEAARVEAERKAAEEAARVEAERKAAEEEEAARVEAERKAAAEAEARQREEEREEAEAIASFSQEGAGAPPPPPLPAGAAPDVASRLAETRDALRSWEAKVNKASVEEVVQTLRRGSGPERMRAALLLAHAPPKKGLAALHAGCARTLLEWLEGPGPDVEAAARALRHLSGLGFSHLKVAVSDGLEAAVPRLASLLQCGTSARPACSAFAAEHAAGALFHVAGTHEAKQSLWKGGGVEALARMLSAPEAGGREQAAAALWKLVQNSRAPAEDREALAGLGAIAQLEGMASRGTPDEKMHAGRVLDALGE